MNQELCFIDNSGNETNLEGIDGKSVIFANNSITNIKTVINHPNSSRIEKLTYFTGEGNRHGKCITGKELESVLTSPLANLQTLSILFAFKDTDQSYIEAIRKAGLTHNLKHLKIHLKNMETKDLVTIFKEKNFPMLETLIIEKISGELTIEQFKTIEHLPIKKLHLADIELSDEVTNYMKKSDWLKQVECLSIIGDNISSSLQIENLIRALPKSIQELSIILKMKRRERIVFIDSLSKILPQLSNLSRLYMVHFEEPLDSIYENLDHSKTCLSVTCNKSDGVFKKSVKNVHFNTTGSTEDPKAEKRYRSLIRSDFPENELTIEKNDTTTTTNIGKFIILIILSLYLMSRIVNCYYR